MNVTELTPAQSFATVAVVLACVSLYRSLRGPAPRRAVTEDMITAALVASPPMWSGCVNAAGLEAKDCPRCRAAARRMLEAVERVRG